MDRSSILPTAGRCGVLEEQSTADTSRLQAENDIKNRYKVQNPTAISAVYTRQ